MGFGYIDASNYPEVKARSIYSRQHTKLVLDAWALQPKSTASAL